MTQPHRVAQLVHQDVGKFGLALAHGTGAEIPINRRIDHHVHFSHHVKGNVAQDAAPPIGPANAGGSHAQWSVGGVERDGVLAIAQVVAQCC